MCACILLSRKRLVRSKKLFVDTWTTLGLQFLNYGVKFHRYTSVHLLKFFCKGSNLDIILKRLSQQEVQIEFLTVGYGASLWGRYFYIPQYSLQFSGVLMTMIYNCTAFFAGDCTVMYACNYVFALLWLIWIPQRIFGQWTQVAASRRSR